MTTTPRIDLYAGIHKALRALMADLLTAVGRMDPADDVDVRATFERLNEGLALCEKHLQHEDRFVHPAIEARRPGATARATLEHAGHVEEFAELRAAMDAFLAASRPARLASAHGLYLAFARWMANNLLHMEHEETHHNRALWDACTDAELLEILARIHANIPPQEMGLVLRWMLPSSNHPERVAQLAGMREGAPREAYEAALALARSRLAPRDWDKLARALETPAAMAA